MPGIKIGYLPQEPQLDPETRPCAKRSRRRSARSLAAKKRLDEVYAAYAEPDADFDKLAAEQAQLEAIIATAGSDAEQQLEIAADALRLPPWDADDRQAVGRREAPRRAVPAAAVEARHAAARRADQPPRRRSVEWLEQFLQRFPGTVVAVTHDRYFLDNAAEWILELDRGHGIPWKGNYSTWLEQKEERLQRGRARRRRAQGDAEGARVGAPEPQGRARPRARRAWRASRSCPHYEYQKRNETKEIFIPVAERLGNEVIEFKNVSQGLRRPPADRQPVASRCRRARSSASSARTAPASRRCSA